MQDRSGLVLLLPCRLEDFSRRDVAEALLAAADAVAVEPGRVSFGRLARLPGALAAGLSGMQAKRMRLPAAPRAVVLFEPGAYPLARALLLRHPGCELWYGPGEAASGELHELALARCAFRFEDSPAGRAQLAAAIDRAGVSARPSAAAD